MKNKRNILIILLLMVLICCVGTVCAADSNNTIHMTSDIDSNEEYISVSNNEQVDNVDESVLSTPSKNNNWTVNVDKLSEDSNNNEESIENHPSKSFTDLNKKINDLNKSEIILEDDYVYQEEYDSNFSEGIVINRSMTIDGQGHMLYFNRHPCMFHINGCVVTLKNIIIYNAYKDGPVNVWNGSVSFDNITFIPENSFLSLNIIVNDMYEVYSQDSVINIEFETSIANADFWVEIPGLLEKTHLTSNDERKAMLAISNITKSGFYSIWCDFIEVKNTGGYYMPDTTIMEINPSGSFESIFAVRKKIIIIYRENPKINNSFHDLQMLINNCTNGEINLEKDYVYNNSTDFYLTSHEGRNMYIIGDSNQGIFINKSIVINGNGHIIDAQNMTRIFNINASNVIIKNITFINGHSIKWPSDFVEFFVTGYTPYNAIVYNLGDFYDATLMGLCEIPSYYGGAIYCIGNNLKIINCSFINNIADYGGAICIKGTNSYLSNLSFINNIANEGGAIYISGKNTTILQSQFDFNQGLYAGSSISNHGDINIQDCNFTNGNGKSVVFYNGNWQLDTMNSTYFNSFVKFPYILDFKYNLTHIYDNYYNLNILFGIIPFNIPICGFFEDRYGYSVNKKFCLNIDGEVYNLQTNGKSQAEINLKLSNGNHSIEVYNPLTKLNIIKSFNITNIVDNETDSVDTVKKISLIIVAKNKVFNKKVKTKLYSVVLKCREGNALKNALITLKIKGKLFKAKTNNKGKATFKITKLNKKGKYKATIAYKGNNCYNKASKKVKLVLK